ncbi:MAG: efflux RND transporter periplasmic adaptor subunit [Candidatus Aminicenantes bacterium]|nr:efflux RND transporter periplasmic adaptor subunit [Candidatus Aminicenantes bacterium]
MKKKIFIAVIVIVIAAVALKFTVFKKENGEELGYKKETLQTGSIQALVDTTGTLNAVRMVDVGAQVSGKLMEINVDFNSVVKAGQIIAKLDPELFVTRVNQSKANYRSGVARVDKAKVSLENMRKKHERAKNLFEKELISYEEMDTAETNYYGAKSDLQQQEASLEQSKSALETSKVDLSYTIIKSPIDGVVISRNVNEGQTVASSLQAPVLFQIANDLTKMQVECSVDEADIGSVQEGQSVRFTVDAYPKDNFQGEVKQVRYSPEVVSNVVTYTAIVEVDNPDMKLRPGMTATVSIVTGEARNKLLIPNTALRFNPNLSPEEMRALFQEMRGGQQEQQRNPSGSNRQFGGGMPGGMGGGMGRMRDMARVWYEDENGKLKMVTFKPGVTDNIFTEITGSDVLIEGMEVIVGENSGSNTSSSRSSQDAMRMMRFMR